MPIAALAEADDLHRARRYDAAIAAYRRAVAADPGLFEAWMGLGMAAATTGAHAAAIAALRRALGLRPGVAWLRVNLAKSLFALGYVGDAVRQNDIAIAEGPDEVRAMALRNQASIAPGDPGLDNAAIRAIRSRWAAAEARGVRPLPARPQPGGKLRLAYYGAFFDRPNWMKMYMGVLNAHDRDRFELHLIVDGPLPSAAAGYREQDADRIWEVTGLPNDALAGHIAAAGIDILVDLNGYSHQTRLPLLLHRAAPVQVAWNGMYGMTGFAGVDALIGDAMVVPPGEEAFLTETLFRVAHTYLPFWPFYPTPEVAPPPCLATGQVTFGSLASAYKITDVTIAAWAAILRASPGARLLLRNRALDEAGNRADLLARFAAVAIAPERLILEGGAGHDEFLRSYARIDIALDTFPYNGGTTTAEALWQGVPVLTRPSDRWAGRTSLSILAAAGLAEFCAEDLTGLASRLAADPQALAVRRASQRARLAASPACDPAALARALETIYRALAGAERAERLGEDDG